MEVDREQLVKVERVEVDVEHRERVEVEVEHRERVEVEVGKRD